MDNTADPITLALTGQLPFILIASAIIALPLSWALLWLYRRAVVISMKRSQGNSEISKNCAGPGAPRTSHLELCNLDTVNEAENNSTSKNLFAQAKQGPRFCMLVYTISATVFVSIITATVLLSGTSEFSLTRSLLVFTVYAWPMVLTVYLVGPTTSQSLKTSLVIYFLVLMVLSIVALSRNVNLTVGQLITLWGITNLPPSVLFFLFMAKPIRAVGPLVISFMIFALTGSVTALAIVGSSDNLLRKSIEMGSGIGLNASGIYFSIIIFGFVLFAILGWLSVIFIRRAYVAKTISDQSMTVDALWLLFALVYSIGLVFEGFVWIFAGLIAFLAFKGVTNVSFRSLRHKFDSTSAKTNLLVLRVFSLGKRSELLFHKISNHWRYNGPIQLISGPDLATSMVEPHEFLGFVNGKVARLFIKNESEMVQKLASLDNKPDFDHRYRVNDYFCHVDMWKLVLSKLVGSADAILMDLRGFNSQNSGCIHELNELVNQIQLARVVLVVDNSTDKSFLDQTLQNSWRQIQSGSPNLAYEKPQLFLYNIKNLKSTEISRLIQWLAIAAAKVANNPERITSQDIPIVFEI